MLVYAIGLTTRFRRITVREGMLLEGPAGWGEFCPFPEYDDAECVPWLAAAVEAAQVGWPAPVRDRGAEPGEPAPDDHDVDHLASLVTGGKLPRVTYLR